MAHSYIAHYLSDERSITLMVPDRAEPFPGTTSKRYSIKVSPLKLKKMIVQRMQREESDAWVLIEKLLRDGLR
jgi:hypothetical protein